MNKELRPAVRDILLEEDQVLYEWHGARGVSGAELLPLVEQVWLVERVVIALRNTTSTVFLLRGGVRLRARYLAGGRTGSLFLAALKTNYNEIKERYPLHQFNPYLEVFFRCALECCPYGLPWDIGDYEGEVLEDAVSVLNRMVSSIRKALMEENFKNALADFERSSNKNYKSLTLYIDSLFESHARMLVLRVDLAYQNKYSSSRVSDKPVTYSEAKRHREDFFRNVRRKVLDDSLIGFAWKLEYGLEKGFHYHVMFFLDGSKVRQDVTIAKVIGAYWVEVVTKQKGLYYNCNAVKSRYRSCGIGMVEHSDGLMRENLMKAAIYLTKSDYYMKMIAPSGGRCFGRGVAPLPKLSGVKRGRPRKSIE